MVEIIAGNARGERGHVIKAEPAKGRVFVEGKNLVWKHVKRSRQHPRGQRIEVEGPIDASNVMLVCPSRDCASYDRPVRVRHLRKSDGQKVRTCARCGAEIPRNL